MAGHEEVLQTHQMAGLRIHSPLIFDWLGCSLCDQEDAMYCTIRFTSAGIGITWQALAEDENTCPIPMGCSVSAGPMPSTAYTYSMSHFGNTQINAAMPSLRLSTYHQPILWQNVDIDFHIVTHDKPFSDF